MVKLLTRIALALLALVALPPASPASADGGVQVSPSQTTVRVLRSQSWIEEWDPVARAWVRSGEYHAGSNSAPVTANSGARQGPLGVFGPFIVLDASTAAIMGSTNRGSPADFARMRMAFPDIRMLELIDAPGTVNDIANLQVGRMIRAAGISTHVPANGSVRSGAVELFLAGKTRTMDPGARFAVHSWRDERGRGPQDFAPEDPVNRLYTAYYEDMGMSKADAQAFYDMTNSVSHSSALWFGPEVMRTWIARRDARPEERDATIYLAFEPKLISQPSARLDD
jgi:hypothetical protein